MASGSGEGKGKEGRAGGGYQQYAASYGTGVYDDRQWWPWLVPTVLGACVAVFAVEMYENDCPKHGSPLGGDAACVAGFLRRFAFQPLRENPLLGPSSATYVSASLFHPGSPDCPRLMRILKSEVGIFGEVGDLRRKLVVWADFKCHR
jgi:hypothetical protein